MPSLLLHNEEVVREDDCGDRKMKIKILIRLFKASS